MKRYMLQSIRSLLTRFGVPSLVFMTGAIVLVVEIVGMRTLSPFFGNTLYSTSSMINTVLLALSLGYYVGGVYVARFARLQTFLTVIFASGCVLFVTVLTSLETLTLFSTMFTLQYAPIAASLVLFFVPCFMLALLSPAAVILYKHYRPDMPEGRIIGLMSFVSTLGSIAGSTAAAFYLIPTYGVHTIFVSASLGLMCIGAIPLCVRYVLQSRSVRGVTLFGLVLAALLISSGLRTDASALYQKDGTYEQITIRDTTYAGRPARFFYQDRSTSGAMFTDTPEPRDMPFEYTKYYSVYSLFNTNLNSALVIGGGAYTIPKALAAEYPNSSIVVAEIEPSLHKISEKYFGLSQFTNIHTRLVDGRSLLRESSDVYNLIYSDVYYSLFGVPSQFTTVEFFSEAKSRLAPNGVFIASMIGDLSRQDPSLILSEMRTFRSVFPNSYFFATEDPLSVSSQNVIFVGVNSEEHIPLSRIVEKSSRSILVDDLMAKQIDVTRFNLDSYALLTDDYAPTEYLTSRVLNKSFTSDSVSMGNEVVALIQQILSYGPRYAGSEGHDMLASFIKNELSLFGLHAFTQTWQQMLSTGTHISMQNVIAQLNPEATRRIILVTHYDSRTHVVGAPHPTSEFVPGANDSASGTAMLVELARVLSRFNMSDLGIDFVFFDGEEGDPNVEFGEPWKPLGSEYFTKNIRSVYPNQLPEGAIVIDMVCDSSLQLYKEKYSSRDASVQTALLWSIGSSKYPDIFNLQEKYAIFDDHTSFNAIGIPATLVIDFDYPYFHTERDTLDKCSARSLDVVFETLLEYVNVNVR